MLSKINASLAKLGYSVVCLSQKSLVDLISENIRKLLALKYLRNLSTSFYRLFWKFSSSICSFKSGWSLKIGYRIPGQIWPSRDTGVPGKSQLTILFPSVETVWVLDDAVSFLFTYKNDLHISSEIESINPSIIDSFSLEKYPDDHLCPIQKLSKFKFD